MIFKNLFITAIMITLISACSGSGKKAETEADSAIPSDNTVVSDDTTGDNIISTDETIKPDKTQIPDETIDEISDDTVDNIVITDEPVTDNPADIDEAEDTSVTTDSIDSADTSESGDSDGTFIDTDIAADTETAVDNDITVDTDIAVDNTSNDADSFICFFNETKCGGNYIMKCAGTTWTANTDCAASNKVCAFEEGAAICKTKPIPLCGDGEMKCDNTTIMWCSAGAWFVVKDCADDSKICVKNGSDVSCMTSYTPGCNNSVIDPGETCDKNSTDCTTLGKFIGGTAACLNDCSGFDTSTCTREDRKLTVTGTVNVYHPTNVPGYGDISSQLGMAVCHPQPIAGAASPYGSITANINNISVNTAGAEDPIGWYGGHGFTGSFGETTYGSAAGVTFLGYKEDSGDPYYIVQDSNYVDPDIANPVILFSVDDNASGTVNLLSTGAQAWLYIVDINLSDGTTKCVHGIAMGSLTVGETLLTECSALQTRCVDDTRQTCSAGKWADAENCASSGKICRDGTCKVYQSGDRFDFTGPTYDGDILLTLNTSTDGQTTVFSGTLPMSPINPDITPMPNGFLGEKLFIDPQVPLPAGLDRSKIIRHDSRIQKLPQMLPIGSKYTFYVYDFASGSEKGVPATLIYNGTKCEIWSEDTSPISGTTAQNIASEFDNNIYSLITTNFYAASDVNGDGKIAILFAGLGGFAAGYFSSGDYYSRTEYQYSNERDMLYIEKASDEASIKSTISHEFQHLCHSNRNIIVESDAQSGDLVYRWIDEGLAMAAQHLYEGVQSSWIYVFNNSPYNQPVADGNSFLFWDYDDNNKVYSDYALAYIFFQYLRIQAGDPANLYREIIESNTNSYVAVENAIHKYIDANKSFASFMTDFRIAMLVNDLTGVFGFHGESGFTFSPLLHTGGGLNLEGGGAVYSNITASFSEPSNKGANISYVGIKTK